MLAKQPSKSWRGHQFDPSFLACGFIITLVIHCIGIRSEKCFPWQIPTALKSEYTTSTTNAHLRLLIFHTLVLAIISTLKMRLLLKLMQVVHNPKIQTFLIGLLFSISRVYTVFVLIAIFCTIHLFQISKWHLQHQCPFQ